MSCDQYKIKFDEDNYQIKQEITIKYTLFIMIIF